MRSYVLAAALCCASPALAQHATVTTLDGSQGWAAPAGELNPGASATITANPVLDSDGSLQLSGDRTRVLNGNNYAPTTNYGAANSLVSLTGDYLVSNGGNGGIQSPAFRVYVQDGSQRSELIWEAAYNGGYTLGTADSVQASDLFYQYVAGCGATLVGGGCTNNGTYAFHTVADWGDLYSSSAFVSAFGVGNGSGAGASFNAFADNLALTTTQGTNSVNFAAATGAVPEPATWAMMLVGFGVAGGAMRRRQKVATAVRFA